MLRRLLPLLVVLSGLFFSRAAEASHFRHGTIAWTVPDPGAAPRTVQFTVTVAWRSSMTDGTTLYFGDGTNAGYQMGTNIGSATDAAGNAYTMFRYIISHTYAGGATEFTAYFESCCRLSTLQNGADGNFRVETKVSLAAGNTGGPVSGSPAVIQMQTGGVRTYTFPAFDPDNDAVTCRFGTSAETGLPAGQVVPVASNSKSPTVSSVPNGCALNWDLNGAAAGRQYVVHLVLESTHGGKTSSTAIDLVVETVAAASPTCAGSGVFVAEVGQAFSATTAGTNAGGGTLKLFTLGAPAGASFSPASGSSGASPYASTFSWTPGASFAGTTQVVMTSYTNASNQSGTCFLTIQVPMCANYGQACSVGVGECARSGLNVCADKNVTVCSATPGVPSAEICDGKDNDCDGAVDDALTDTGLACASGQPGICGPGTTVCAGAGQPGATLGCTPNIAPGSQTETCDGLDNDCDGAVDEGFSVGAACSNGVGECVASGTIQCLGNGSAACNAVPTVPSAETCDGKDNDCDGAVDNGFSVGAACSNGVGECAAAGTIQCLGNGSAACNAIPTVPSAETCDGKDNDCDGAVDNGFNVGAACSNGVGECNVAGTIQCLGNGSAACNAVPTVPSAETCDGKDNDCDGAVDNGFNVGAACSNGVGECNAPGTIQCLGNGSAACNAVPTVPAAETCDGKDNDCDGAVDNGFNVGSSCSNGVGECSAAGTIQCLGDGSAACDAVAGQPGVEVCDGLDNDCDGTNDNDALYVGDACSSGASGVCDAGTKVCVSAALTCVSTITPGSQTEVCDGLDNDCNGAVDNGFNVGAACSAGDGVCQTTGSFVCDGLNATKCDAVADMMKQGPELCDGEDNDCDGAVDDNPTDLGDCNTGLDGLCALGAYVCELGGTRICTTLVNAGDVAETCNGVDDDCDGEIDDGFNVGDDCTAGDGVCQTSGKLVCSADETKSECDAAPDESKKGEEICADALDTDCDGYDNNGCGCLVDSDCGAPDTGIVCDNADGATFTCVAGCRDRDDSRCPSPELCTSTDDSIGTCVECLSDVDCGGADSGRVCDASNTCIDGCRGVDGNGCASTLVCTSPDATIGVCVQCTTTADCDGTQICDEATHTCVDECTTKADCDGTQICDEATHTCVDECTTKADCDGTKICDEATHTCVDECTTKADCDGTQICDEATHTCVDECTTKADCDGTKICAEDTHTCVDECATAADCDGTKICAEDTHTCVDECVTAADCDGTKICAEDTHTCVDECTTAADCDGTQICAEDTHTCVKSEPGPAPSAPANDVFAEGNGIRCAIERGANDDGAAGWLVGGALAAVLAAARRRRRAV